MTDGHDEQFEQARRHVRKLRGFYIHMLVFLAVNAGLVVLNLLKGRPLWFFWATASWGIGLLAHGLSIAGWSFLGGREWEERKVREYVAREKRNGQ